MFEVEKIREEFPILSREVYGKPLVYLDNGATAQKPARVIETLARLYREENANIHRGVHYLSERCTMLYEDARAVVAEALGTPDVGEVVFPAGATAAINTVAYSFSERFLGEGDNVVVSEMEHHSNIVPWQMACQRKGASLRVLPFDDEGALRLELLDGLLDERTKVVAITQASNTLGTMPHLAEVVAKAHAVGAVVVVDGCQGFVHSEVNVRELDCDFYAFSSHKLYGPNGVGVLYGKREWLEQMPPFLGGGDMVRKVTFEKTTYNTLPFKYEAGTPNIGGNIVKGLWEGIQQLASWLWDKVSGWISSIWDGICDFFGIHSPSDEMAWVGEMLVKESIYGICYRNYGTIKNVVLNGTSLESTEHSVHVAMYEHPSSGVIENVEVALDNVKTKKAFYGIILIGKNNKNPK